MFIYLEKFKNDNTINILSELIKFLELSLKPLQNIESDLFNFDLCCSINLSRNKNIFKVNLFPQIHITKKIWII